MTPEEFERQVIEDLTSDTGARSKQRRSEQDNRRHTTEASEHWHTDVEFWLQNMQEESLDEFLRLRQKLRDENRDQVWQWLAGGDECSK